MFGNSFFFVKYGFFRVCFFSFFVICRIGLFLIFSRFRILLVDFFIIVVCGLKFLYMWWLKFIRWNGLFLFFVCVMNFGM